MSATDKPLLKSQNIAIPQYHNPIFDRFEAITGRDGANYFIEKGRIVKDAITGSTTITKGYPTKMFGFGIVNDGTTDLSFTINSFTITVKPHETFDDLFEPFTAITITATGPYRAVVRE